MDLRFVIPLSLLRVRWSEKSLMELMYCPISIFSKEEMDESVLLEFKREDFILVGLLNV